MAQVISFDVDGVLANFTRGFTRYGNLIFGTPVADGNSQQTWMFEDFPELELDKEKCSAIWKFVKTDPDFWATLDPFNPSVMPRIDVIKNRVFITNRGGIDPKEQTERFLTTWGIREPLVRVAEKKVPVAQELNVVAHLDDYPGNCTELADALPDAYIALYYTQYNKHFHEEWRARGGKIVTSIDQFIDECEARGLVEEWL